MPVPPIPPPLAAAAKKAVTRIVEVAIIWITEQIIAFFVEELGSVVKNTLDVAGVSRELTGPTEETTTIIAECGNQMLDTIEQSGKNVEFEQFLENYPNLKLEEVVQLLKSYYRLWKDKLMKLEFNSITRYPENRKDINDMIDAYEFHATQHLKKIVSAKPVIDAIITQVAKEVISTSIVNKHDPVCVSSYRNEELLVHAHQLIIKAKANFEYHNIIVEDWPKIFGTNPKDLEDKQQAEQDYANGALK